jgi:O-antigen ligase
VTGSAPLPAALERRRLLVLWLVTFSCLAWVPGGFSRFVFAKLLVVALAGLVAAFLPPAGRVPRQVWMLLGAGWLLVALAAVVGETRVASLLGRWPRYEGLPVLAMYAGAAWLGARVVGRGVPRSIHLAHACSGMAVVLAFFSVLDVAGTSPLGESTLDRSGSLLGNATDQGLVAMMAGLVVVSAMLDRRDWLLGSGLLGSLVTVGVSGSRIAIALTVVGLAGVVLARRGPGRTVPGGVAGLLGGAVAVLAVAVLVVPTTRDRLLDSGTGSGRLHQWRLTLDLVLDHPVLGVGPSRYVDAFGAYEDGRFVRFTGPNLVADSPHDVLLQALVVGGVPLLVLVLALAVVVVRRARVVLAQHPEAWGPAAAVAAYGAAMLANFTSAGPTCLAAFLAGAVLAETVPGPEPSWRRPVAAGVAGLAVVGTLMSCVAEVRLQDAVEAGTRGDVEAARSAADSASSWRPLDGDVAMLAAQPLAGVASTGDEAAAQATRRLAGRSLERTPETYSSLVALGVARLTEGDVQAAIEVLDHAVRVSPARPAAYVQRGLARATAGDVEGAVADLETAASIDPRDRVVRRLLRQLREP